MYAFGDDPNPAPESVAVLEDIVTEYINEMVPKHPGLKMSEGFSWTILLSLVIALSCGSLISDMPVSCNFLHVFLPIVVYLRSFMRYASLVTRWLLMDSVLKQPVLLPRDINSKSMTLKLL